MTFPTPRDLIAADEERVARMRHAIHGPSGDRALERRIRRWVGRQLVRVGTRVAADPTLRPVRSL
jgi:hypothetical protein